MSTEPAELRILVVEDNLDSQHLICELLAALGHHAEGVASAEIALPLLAQQHFDVLFTDVSLPGMSGIELARQSGITQPDLKVIYASGYGAQLGKNVGDAAFCLPKPYDLDQLQHILTAIHGQLRSAM